MSSNKNKILENDYKIYSLHLKKIFEQIDNYISKKNNYYQEILDYIKQIPTLLEKDKTSNLNADKYFPIISKSLQYESYKIAHCVLENIKILISNNFLLGKTKLNEINSNLDNNNNENKTILDLMIESLYNLENYSDEEIWFDTIEVFNEIVINKNIFLSKEQLIKILDYDFNLYLKSKINKSNEVEEKIKNLINEYYNNMTLLSNKFDFQFQSSLPPERKDSNISSIDSFNNDLIYKMYENFENNNIKWKNNPIDLLICRIGKQMIDSICIEDAKGTLNKINNYKVNSLVPKNNNDFSNPLYRRLSNIKILNECNFESGYFGWCYICRKKANLYCKERRVPLCSYKCKEILNQEEEKISNYQKGILYNENCCEIFKYLSSIFTIKICFFSTNITPTKITTFKIIFI